jgi:uncharacterized membrane protein
MNKYQEELKKLADGLEETARELLAADKGEAAAAVIGAHTILTAMMVLSLQISSNE